MRVLLAAVGLALAGCATPPLPAMTPAEYQYTAKTLHVANVCEERGAIDPSLLGYGYTRIKQRMAAYSYDIAYLEREIVLARKTEVTAAECNHMARVFAQLRDEYQRNTQDPGFTKHTQCYSGPIGTNCTTY